MTNSSLDGVTVIVPWYGVPVADVLRVVASIDRQTYRGHVEVILCDDGSPPELGAELAAALEVRPGRRVPVTMCRHPRSRGAGAARNTAAQRARTAWLLWVDADDALADSTLACLMDATAATGVAMGTAQCWVVNGDCRTLRRPDVYLRLAHEHNRTVSDPLAQVIFSLHPQMIRRDAFERLGGFDESLQRAEMTDLFLRFVTEWSVAAVRAVDEPLYLHYRRMGSLSSSRDLMDTARREVLLAYSRRNGLPIDDVRYMGRCSYTGARHYAPIVQGKPQLPPYVDIRSDGVHLCRI